MAITQDRSTLITASSDHSVKVWNLPEGKLIYKLDGHAATVQAVAIAPNGELAVSGSNDCTIRVWDVEKGRQKRELQGHVRHVRGVAIRPDGVLAASASSDRTVKVWNLDTGEAIATFRGDYPFLTCLFAHDGETILAGDAFGYVHFFRLHHSGF